MAALATIAPFGFSFDPVRFLAAYRALGCRSCQFYRNEGNPPTTAQALAASRAAELPFDSIHGLFGEHLDPSSPDPAHRRRCLEVYEDEGRLARDLGGPMVVVHPAAWNPGRRVMPRAEAEAAQQPRWPHLHAFLGALAEAGERLGVVYLIENQPFNCPLGHDPAALAAAVLRIGSPAIRMCFDTGHANITTDVPPALKVCAPVIAYLHVHDNDGASDDHRFPGEGSVDWPAAAAVLWETGCGATRMLELFYDEPRVEEMDRRDAARLAAALAL